MKNSSLILLLAGCRTYEFDKKSNDDESSNRHSDTLQDDGSFESDYDTDPTEEVEEDSSKIDEDSNETEEQEDNSSNPSVQIEITSVDNGILEISINTPIDISYFDFGVFAENTELSGNCCQAYIGFPYGGFSDEFGLQFSSLYNGQITGYYPIAAAEKIIPSRSNGILLYVEYDVRLPENNPNTEYDMCLFGSPTFYDTQNNIIDVEVGGCVTVY